MGHPTAAIIAIINVDTSLLPDVGIPLNKPSIEHTLMKCPLCRRDAWIGPAQYMKLQFNPNVVVRCYVCLLGMLEDGMEIGAMVSLDRTADEKPRRT